MIFAIEAGPSEFAPVALLLVVAPLAMMVSTGGVDQQLFRVMVHRPHSQVSLGTGVRVISVPILVSPLLAICTGAVGYIFDYNVRLFATAGAAACLQALGLLIFASFLRARTSSKGFLALYGGIAVTAFAARLFSLYVLNLDTASAWIVGDIFNAAICLVLSFAWLAQLQRSGGIVLSFRTLLGFGFPMTIHGVFQWILGSSDRLVLGAILGPAALGTYGAVYQFAGLFNVAASEINKTGLHRYAWNERTNVRDLIRADQRLLLKLWLCGILPVLIALILLQRSGYQDAILLGFVLYISFLPLVLYLPIANVVTISEGSARLMSVASGFGAVTNVAVNGSLAKAIGLYAGAVGNTVGYLVMALCLAAFSKSRVKDKVVA
ncbi:lipopolysaccharide biosynthesis protein [Gordonia hongkongensis]|uniref:lipopolysaccharide biosynthesis protein n=1 Tax=Gordonia hongkongensis TaxID=1701090 RepID=UPI003D70BB26